MIQPRPAAPGLSPRAACALLCVLAGSAAIAGRPLAVDDAGVDDAGQGHIELWAAEAPGSKAYHLAPAYSPAEGLELGALLARDTRAAITLRALQAKWRITPSQDDSCNTGAVIAWSRETASPHTVSLTGLLTCRGPGRGSVHVNLGAAKPADAGGKAHWGMAYERGLGVVTPSLEWFGGQGSKPTLQFGLRGDVARNVQLDATAGRRDGAALLSLGTKLQF